MKRSILMSALVIGLVAVAPACGGGGTGPDGKPADGAAGGDSEKPPIEELKELSDGIQKGVDDLLKPITDAEAAIEAVAKLPGEIKASVKAGFKLDTKKLGAAAQKVVNGEGVDVSALGFTEKEAEAKAKVEGALNKLKEVVDGIKATDEKIKALADKVKEAVVKVPTLVVKATAKAQIAIKNPFGGAEAKAKAQADMDEVKKIGESFQTKAAEWQKTFTELPAKAAAAKDKMAKAFTKM